jgi:hypothetical protein
MASAKMTAMSFLIAPPVAYAALEVLRIVYGVLLLLTLLQALPQARRFFLSEKFGGYADSSPWSLSLHNPPALGVVLILWFSAAVGLITGAQVVLSALLNLVFCRYFFISMRWKSILRGMGAPGFLSYWTGALVFFLELGARMDPSGRILNAASTAFRIDLGVIMICAGAYKAVAGYPKNEGMELGMINPFWGYWGGLYRPLPPSHWLFKTLNHLAYGTEIVAGVLMLFAPTQLLGAFLLFGSFAWIATHIRLGFLCEMVMVACLAYIPEGSWVASLFPGGQAPPTEGSLPAWAVSLVSTALWTYLVLLPFAKFGQWWNFLAHARLPGLLQTVLERYTNFFGIIIWRVFSVDVTNFYIRILVEDPKGHRTVYSRPGHFDPAVNFRYVHVGEFICVTSLFTTLKYYPANDDLFQIRLSRYAKTIPTPPGSRVIFEYVSMMKENDRFGEKLVAEYVYDPATNQIEERRLDASFSTRSASPVSPVHEGMTPGSYAPRQ